MVLRETTFMIGGVVTIALGVALAAGLWWAGAGWAYPSAWLAAAISVGFGAFFLHVGRDEGARRREYLRAVEAGQVRPPSGPGAPP